MKGNAPVSAILSIVEDAVRREREACAALADDRAAICREARKSETDPLAHVEIHTALEAEHIASMIRARNKKA